MKSFEDLERYLATFANFHGDPVPYDFFGAFTLFLAILDNLAARHLDSEIDGLREYPIRRVASESRRLSR